MHQLLQLLGTSHYLALRQLLWIASMIAASSTTGLSAAGDSLRLVRVEVEAPFEISPIAIPDFSGCARLCIVDFGAAFGDQTATSRAIAAAIKRAEELRGGVVVIPRGEWITGPIHLRSNVNLHLEEGSTLVFSGNPADYLPAVPTSWEGMECYNYSPLIYAYKCHNIGITGRGLLRANLDIWREWYARPTAHLEALRQLYKMAMHGVPIEQRQMTQGQANLRPQFIQFNRCENVLLEGVTIHDSPFWVIHPFLSRSVVIRGVHVRAHGHNNDGVDPEMSENLLIEDCVFDQGDDAVAIKSGREHDAWRLASPARNIVVRNCRVRNAHQLVAIGSELSGGVENVLVENCQLDPSIRDVGHLLFIKTNSRRGGFVRNIAMRNVTAGSLRYGVLGIETDVVYQWRTLMPEHFDTRLTPIEHVRVSDVQVGEVQFISRIQGEETLPVKDVQLTRIAAGAVSGEPVRNKNVQGFELSMTKTASPTTK